MNGKIEAFTLEFFENLGSKITKEGEVYIIENITPDFSRARGKEAPYRICFQNGIQDAEYVSKESALFLEIVKYLQKSGKTTLLKIDFDVDALQKIKAAVSLNNCEITNVAKKDRNNFFSRFTFMTTFTYLNESEKVMKEVYAHDGAIVEGDLSGYHVVEGRSSEASADHLEKDYLAAKGHLKESLKEKTEQISKRLAETLDQEIKRIKDHYSNSVGELGGDLQGQLEKIKDLEIQIRSASEEDSIKLRQKRERLQKSLAKIGDDNSKERILKEQEFTIRNAMQRHSLNIDNALINTTVIYYPVYCFNLFIKRGEAGRFMDMVYDPLLDRVEEIICEACEKRIIKLNLCSSGHISCDSCLNNCDDCGKMLCEKCYQRACGTCGKAVCKSCIKVCRGCGAYACKDHLRTDGVSGEQRCTNCLRPCMRCHSLSEPKYFGEAIDGSKVCQKCLGAERRKGAMKEIFSRD